MPKPSAPIPEATVALATDLRFIARQLKRRLREQTDLGGMTWSQVDVLRCLEQEGPTTTSALARIIGMRPHSMGAIVSSLVQLDFVRGEPHPDDGRQTLLYLTAAYRAWIEAARAARTDWLSQRLHSRFSAQEQARLAEAVDLFKRLVEP